MVEYNKGTIYTDSKYAYGVVHTFGKIWEERGFINSKGKMSVHEELIKEILKALKDPLEVAVVHVKGHQRGTSIEIQGNNLVDQTDKEAVLGKEEQIFGLENLKKMDGEKIPIFTEQEQEELQKQGGVRDELGKWIMPDGRQVLNKNLSWKILEILHASTHWGTQALCDHFLRTYVCIGVFGIAKAITKDCMASQKINNKIMKKVPVGGRELAKRPFQNIQIDFTEFCQVQKFKYLLVIIDHLTHWMEAFPTVKATAETVSKILLEQIIPHYALVNTIDSERGPHFTARILQNVIETLGMTWKFQTPWRPQSSGRVERANQTLKIILTKLVDETKMNWVKCPH